MKKIKLNNGYEIPEIFFGPVLPRTGTGYGAPSDGSQPAEFMELCQAAVDAGFRAFDSASRYGTESKIGEFIRNCGIPREELFFCSKLNNMNHGYESALADIDGSLERSGLDYLDLYLIHCPVPMKGEFVNSWKALEKRYKEGKIKAIGVSNFTVQHFYDLAEVSDVVPAVNQIEQHPFYVQNDLQAYMKHHNIVSMSYSPLGGGKFANDPRLLPIAEKHNKSIVQIILRWHIQMGFIPVTRSSVVSRTMENGNIFDFELDADDMAYIASLNHLTRTWHNPQRFPGTNAHKRVETDFIRTVDEEIAGLPDDKKNEILEKENELLASQDVDRTIDYIIYCFNLAVSKYGPNVHIEDQAAEEAIRLAKEFVKKNL